MLFRKENNGQDTSQLNSIGKIVLSAIPYFSFNPQYINLVHDKQGNAVHLSLALPFRKYTKINMVI